LAGLGFCLLQHLEGYFKKMINSMIFKWLVNTPIGLRDTSFGPIGSPQCLRRHIKTTNWINSAAFGLFAFGVSLTPALADYELAPGDVVELATANGAQLKHQAVVELGGEATFPLVGPVQAAGLTLAKLRERLVELLGAKVMRTMGQDGRELLTVLTPDSIMVSIAEYRPVYLLGDVAKPGELRFRPGLSVRQAVALAGGYDAARFKMNNPFLEVADFKGDYESLWIEYARRQAAGARLRAELEGSGTLDLTSLPKTAAPQAVVEGIERLEQENFKARRTAFENEQHHLIEAIAKEDKRVTLLVEQEAKERGGAELDAEDTLRVQQLFNAGRMPITRVQESRRNSLLSSTRVLQTVAQANQVERQRDELKLRLLMLKDSRQVGLMRELEQTDASVAQTRARLEAVGTKLVYTGMVKSQLVGAGAPPPEIKIVRTEKGAKVHLTGDVDDALAPGDVVEIALQKTLIAPQQQSLN
jgi:polysaccharide biosynthesis/export protein